MARDPQVGGFLADMLRPATDSSHGLCEAEDVVSRIAHGHSIVFVACRRAPDASEIDYLAVMVCEVIQYPQRRVFSIEFMAGREMENWKHFQPTIEAYARELGCEEMHAKGRKGWAKLAPDFSHAWTVLRKEL
jgi:hypothetical protein